jgi:hypothetical protein
MRLIPTLVLWRLLQAPDLMRLSFTGSLSCVARSSHSLLMSRARVARTRAVPFAPPEESGRAVLSPIEKPRHLRHPFDGPPHISKWRNLGKVRFRKIYGMMKLGQDAASASPPPSLRKYR